MSRTWFNGALTEGPLAVERGERGLLLGDGLFETILVLNRKPLWGNMHFARLQAAAHELGLGFDRDTLDDAVAEILDGTPKMHHLLRVTITRAPEALGIAAVPGGDLAGVDGLYRRAIGAAQVQHAAVPRPVRAGRA